MDCEQAEKDALAQLEKDLLSARDTLKTKEDQVQAWLTRAEELRQSIKERMLKKRRSDDGSAKATGGGDSDNTKGDSATDAAATTETSQEQKAADEAAMEKRIQEEAKRLSRA
eukprot:1696514-Pyramimonas_sp.AAC.1